MSVKRYMLQGSDNKRHHATLYILKRITLHVDRSDLSDRLIETRGSDNLPTTSKLHNCNFYWHNYTMRIFFTYICISLYSREPLRCKIGHYFPIRTKREINYEMSLRGKIYQMIINLV